MLASLSLKKKKFKNLFPLEQGNVGKGHPAGGNPEQLVLWFLAETASFREKPLLPRQTLFAFTPKNKLCAWQRLGRAGSSWRGPKQGKSGVRLLESGSRFPAFKLASRETEHCFPLAFQQPGCRPGCNSQPLYSKSASQEKREKERQTLTDLLLGGDSKE